MTMSGPSATMFMFIIGDDGGNFDDDVLVGIQPGHLEVHPHQHGADPTPSVWRFLIPRSVTTRTISSA